MLGGYRYPIVGPVRFSLVPSTVTQLVLGEPTKDAHPGVSVVVWKDWSGGFGQELLETTQPVDRSSWSELNGSTKGHLVMPNLATQTAAGAAAAVGIINEYASVIYAAFGTDLRTYAVDTWTNVRTLAAAATDSINIYLGGTEYLVIAQGTDYDYWNGAAWARSTKDTRHLAFWDERLWGINFDGQLWWSTTLGTEVNDAQLQLPAGHVTSLFVARAADGELRIHCGTTKGLYVHDLDNKRFVETELVLPLHTQNGLGAKAWRSSIYFPAGLSLLQYVARGSEAVIRNIGPNRDGGVPTDRTGQIILTLGTVNELLAVVSGGASADASILAWDEKGWQCRWIDNGGFTISTAHVSNAYSSYRLWWAYNNRVYWMTLPREITNPEQLTGQTYQAGSLEHYTPWFDAGERNVNKTGIRILLEAGAGESSGSIATAYAVNGSSSYTALGSITSAGVGFTSYSFPNNTFPRAGVEFRSIRFRWIVTRGTTNTLTPDIRHVEFFFQKKLPPRWHFDIVVDLDRPEYGGLSREQRFDRLVSAIQSSTLLEFTFRNRDSNEASELDPYNYYVTVDHAEGQQFTGNEWTGKMALRLTEKSSVPTIL